MDKEAGERLKKIRADKGIGLEEVAERTKVPLNILRAIEEGEFINLEPVYINGFIKIYCKYLGIDPSDFIKGLQKPQVTMKLSDEEEKAITFLQPLVVRAQFPWKSVLTAVGIIGVLIVLVLIGRGISNSVKQRSRTAALKPQVNVVSNIKEKKKAHPAPTEKNSYLRNRRLRRGISPQRE